MTNHESTETRPVWAQRYDVPERFVASVPKQVVTLMDELARLQARRDELWEQDRREDDVRRTGERKDAEAIREAALSDGPLDVDGYVHTRAAEEQIATTRKAYDAVKREISETERALSSAMQRQKAETERAAWDEYAERWATYQRLQTDANEAAWAAGEPLAFIDWARQMADRDMDATPLEFFDPRERGALPVTLRGDYRDQAVRDAAVAAERAGTDRELTELSRSSGAAAASVEDAKMVEKLRRAYEAGAWLPPHFRERFEAERKAAESKARPAAKR
jgi:hypothetical protein